ncbi:hypothetical protein [Peribacillus sp. NPDC097895]|uniref:hypothetical protein n=1 Tax=Peribacillus sp. NPDC097895 TaxID=3390619 RepID=UPI003D067DA9
MNKGKGKARRGGVGKNVRILRKTSVNISVANLLERFKIETLHAKTGTRLDFLNGTFVIWG